jgi:hypothetical protein
MSEASPPAAVVVFDAGAYRALVRGLVAPAARDAARALRGAEQTAGVHAVASPFALWPLLADVAAVVAPVEGEERAARSEQRQERATRARAALAAVAVHCEKAPGAPGAHPFALLDDPESRLCVAVGLKPPPGLAAWNEYLASLATDLAAEPTPERARRLAAPLAHVAERARTTAEDYADEMQDAVLAAYDAASDRWAWNDATSDEVRQQTLAGRIAPVADDDSAEVGFGERLILDLLRRDPLLRAVAARRAARAHRLASGAAESGADIEVEPTLDEAAHVAERFPAGVALAREVLRRVIAGELEMGGRTARRWLWDLHVALGLRDERGVTGGPVLAPLVASPDVVVPGVESLDAYRARLGACTRPSRASSTAASRVRSPRCSCSRSSSGPRRRTSRR